MPLNQPSDSDSTAQQDTSIDLSGLLRRHYQLIIFCTAVTGLLAGAYCLFTDRVYESFAEVLIEEKHSPAFNDQTIKERPSLSTDNEIETHRLVISSPLILERAEKKYKLGRLSIFDGADHAKVWSDNLIVEVPDNDASILQVRFRGDRPKDCFHIVSAVVDTYKQYLDETSSNLGKEITTLISQGQKDLRSQLQELENQYAEFQKEAPLLWREEQGVNIFLERQVEIEERRKKIVVDRTLLEAKIRGIETAMTRGQKSRQALYYEALIELRNANSEETVEKESLRGYGIELSRDYMNLLAQERAMSIEYGEGHPDLSAIRIRLEELRLAVERSMGRTLTDGVTLDAGATLDEATVEDYINTYIQLLGERYVSLGMQLEALDADFQATTREAQAIQEYITKDKSLRSDRERTEKLFDAVVARLEEINIIQDYGGESMTVIASPSHGRKVWPRIPIVMVLSMILGSLIGLMWAFIREVTLDVFTDPNQVREAIGAPILGQIPLQDPANDSGDQVDGSIAVIHDTKGWFAESIRGIRTALHFGTLNNGNSIQFTSPVPGDGKSTAATNLAASIAKSGKRVVLIDADMRKPTIHKLLGLDNDIGLVDMLRGEADIASVVKKSSLANLDVVVAGNGVENPSELLTYDTFDSFVNDLKLEYDRVIIDSPPVLAVSDPSIIAPRVDGVVVVVRMREQVKTATERTAQILDEVGANLVGAIVNGIVSGHGGYGGKYGNLYRSGYSYGYGFDGSEAYGPSTSRDPFDQPLEKHRTVPQPTIREQRRIPAEADHSVTIES